MRMLTAKKVPEYGDLILVGRKLAVVLNYDPGDWQVTYALTYEDTKTLPTLDFKASGLRLMDDPTIERPRVWTRTGAMFQFHVEFDADGSHHDDTTSAVSRKQARANVLYRYGKIMLGNLATNSSAQREGKKRIAWANGRNEFDPAMVTVNIDQSSLSFFKPKPGK